ncbi:MAG: hypothetical protein M0Z98_06235 [Actinomycetales bacterium]|nr:hypothetical protein [Actinomycetales bacterium]
MRRHRTIAVVVAATAVAVTSAVPTVARAAEPLHRQTMQLDCAGLGTVEIVAPASPHDSWGVAQLIGGGHLVPVSFEHRVYDDTAGVTLFDGTVTHSPAHSRQATITCSSSQQAELGEVVPPDFVWPDGVAPSDTVTISFIATAVPEP